MIKYGMREFVMNVKTLVYLEISHLRFMDQIFFSQFEATTIYKAKNIYTIYMLSYRTVSTYYTNNHLFRVT